MVNKGGENKFGKLAFKNSRNNTYSRKKNKFYMKNAMNISDRMYRGNRTKIKNILDNFNRMNSKKINPDILYENNFQSNQSKYEHTTNLNLVNREILMASSISDIEKFMSSSDKRRIKNIIDSILKNQKKVVKMMYKSRKIDRDNYDAIKSFIN